MEENKDNQTRLKTVSYDKINTNRRRSNLRQLQLNILDSLTKGPIINIKKRNLRKLTNRNANDKDYENYDNKINLTLSKYQLSIPHDKDKEEEINPNDLGPNEKYIDKDDKKLIKKIYHLNSLYSNRGLPTLNEQSRLKVVIPEQEYPNPFQSLGVIKANRHLYDEISKDFLYRQSDLFNQKIIDIQKYKSKFGSIKIQQTQVSASNNKYDIPVIDLTEKKDKQSFGINHILPQNGILKLFTYYKYPNKNFPEGREQFSLFSKGNEIIISGGITINMKTLTIWSLNLEKLEWKKININGYSYNRYGHTGIYYQNKIYFFGGKIKYQKNSMTCGLEVFNFQDGQFTAPSAGKLIPEPRRNHTAELLGNQIFIFGGITNTNEVLNDCFLLNINPLKWYTCIINKYTPGPHLYGHTSCVVIPTYILKNHKFSIYSYPNIEPGKANSLIKEKGIYVFGGKSKEEGGISNQLWILVTGKKPLEWIQPNTKGKPPSPRYSHSMSFYERGNFLIIHGGRNDSISDNIALNDTYLFDLENLEWMKVELYSGMKDFKVLNRCGHQSMIYLDKLIIVGGMNNNNYLGSSLMIINMDFSYMSKPKTFEEIMMKELKDKNDIDSKRKLSKIKIDLKHNQLGVVTNITLPPIK
jgi:hypothetical protein